MKYLFPAIFLFSIILTGCSNVKETIVNSNNFHLREGFRDRLFDNRHTYSIAVWIEAKNEYMKNEKLLSSYLTIKWFILIPPLSIIVMPMDTGSGSARAARTSSSSRS